MKKNFVKVGLLLSAGTIALAGCLMEADAKLQDELWAYDVIYDDQDNIIYDFNEIQVTLPADWADRYVVQDMDNGLYFSSKTVRDELSSLNSKLSPDSGELFAIYAEQDYSFVGQMPCKAIFGSSDNYIYYLSVVQGEPYWGCSDEAEKEWMELADDIDWIEEHVVLTSPGGGVVDMDQLESEDTEYILKDSSVKKLTREDLDGMNADELQMAINEIYARNHRKFATKEIQKYFESKSWYKGTIDADKFDPTSLNQYENENIAMMLTCMNESGKAAGSAGSSQTVSTGSLLYATATVNIRSNPSTSGTIMGVVPQGGQASTGVHIAPGSFRDSAVFETLSLYDLGEYYKLDVTYATDASFGFMINRMDAVSGSVLETLATGTADLTGDGAVCGNIYFSFPDNHLAYPDVTDIVVSGVSGLEGITLVNNSVPGHEFS